MGISTSRELTARSTRCILTPKTGTTPNDPDHKEGLFAEFWKGYEEQDAQIKADKRLTEEKDAEGFTTGAAETVFHPFRWLRPLIR